MRHHAKIKFQTNSNKCLVYSLHELDEFKLWMWNYVKIERGEKQVSSKLSSNRSEIDFKRIYGNESI